LKNSDHFSPTSQKSEKSGKTITHKVLEKSLSLLAHRSNNPKKTVKQSVKKSLRNSYHFSPTGQKSKKSGKTIGQQIFEK